MQSSEKGLTCKPSSKQSWSDETIGLDAITAKGVWLSHHVYGSTSNRFESDLLEKYLVVLLKRTSSNFAHLTLEQYSGELKNSSSKRLLSNDPPQSIDLPFYVKEEKNVELARQRFLSAILERYAYLTDDKQDLVNAENVSLRNKVSFLEAQLRKDSPHVRLYRIGAGGFFISSISLIMEQLTKIGAPLNPIFAALLGVASLGTLGMAFLVRRDLNKK